MYPDDGLAHFSRAPGYPAFLAVILSFGDAPWLVRTVQSLVGVLGVFLIGALARHTAGDAAAVAATAIAAIYPPLVWLPAYFLRELLYSVIVLTAALVLWNALETSTAAPRAIGRFVGVGTVLGVGALVRPNVVVLIGLTMLFLAFRHSRRAAVVVLVSSLCVIGPWTARNYVTHDRFMLVSALGGLAFWIGNHSLARGEGDLASNPALGAAENDVREAHPGLDPAELEIVYFAEAAAFVRSHPVAWAMLLVQKLFYFVFPIGPSIFMRSVLHRAASWLSYFSLFPFAASGFWQLRRAQPQPVPLWLLGLSAVLTILIFYPQQRYRVPVFDPFLIVCASSLLRPSAIRVRPGVQAPQNRA